MLFAKHSKLTAGNINIAITVLILLCIFSEKSFSQSFSTLPPNSNSAKSKLKACMQDAEIKAKAYAELRRTEVIAKADKNSVVTGAVVGAGCGALFLLFVGADFGLTGLACTLIGTAGGAAHHSATYDEAIQRALKVFEETLKAKTNELREACINELD